MTVYIPGWFIPVEVMCYVGQYLWLSRLYWSMG